MFQQDLFPARLRSLVFSLNIMRRVDVVLKYRLRYVPMGMHSCPAALLDVEKFGAIVANCKSKRVDSVTYWSCLNSGASLHI